MLNDHTLPDDMAEVRDPFRLLEELREQLRKARAENDELRKDLEFAREVIGCATLDI